MTVLMQPLPRELPPRSVGAVSSLLAFTLTSVLALTPSTAAAQHDVVSPTGEKMEIHIERLARWEDGEDNIRFVLSSAARSLWQYFPNHRVGKLIVRSKGGPITLARRGTTGERYIRLNTGDAYWCQYIFQFAHEVGHVLSDNVHYEHTNMWFEESLCEVCSLFALGRVADNWKTQKDDRWKRFVPAIHDYIHERLDKGKLPKDKKFRDWFEGQLGSLQSNHELRTKNLIIAKQLLPLFEAKPEHWAALAYLNRGDIPKLKRFELYLANWHKQVPKKHKPFVASVANEFGITLPLAESK